MNHGLDPVGNISRSSLPPASLAASQRPCTNRMHDALTSCSSTVTFRAGLSGLEQRPPHEIFSLSGETTRLPEPGFKCPSGCFFLPRGNNRRVTPHGAQVWRER